MKSPYELALMPALLYNSEQQNGKPVALRDRVKREDQVLSNEPGRPSKVRTSRSCSGNSDLHTCEDYEEVDVGKCKDCKWFDEEGEPSCCEYGYCHRFPPTIESKTRICTYKSVYNDGWCGEFKVKE